MNPYRKGNHALWIEIEMYVLLFFACSFLGWCMEVTCKLVQFGRFINRGFLLGPLCPIYGTGAVLMAYFLPLWTTQVESTFLLPSSSAARWNISPAG